MKPNHLGLSSGCFQSSHSSWQIPPELVKPYEAWHWKIIMIKLNASSQQACMFSSNCILKYQQSITVWSTLFHSQKIHIVPFLWILVNTTLILTKHNLTFLGTKWRMFPLFSSKLSFRFVAIHQKFIPGNSSVQHIFSLWQMMQKQSYSFHKSVLWSTTVSTLSVGWIMRTDYSSCCTV